MVCRRVPFRSDVGAGVGAGQQEAPVGPVGLAGPDLLAVDHPRAVVHRGAGLDVGEVGARSGLAVALAPELGARDDPGQEAGPLLVGPEGDDRRSEQGLADVADPAGGPGPGVLLVVDDLAVQRQAPPALLLRPADARPAVGAEVALPGQSLVEEPVVVARAAPPADLCEVAAQALLEEGADLVAEGLVLDVEPQVHDRRRYPNLTERQISCQATSVTIGSDSSCERSSLWNRSA